MQDQVLWKMLLWKRDVIVNEDRKINNMNVEMALHKPHESYQIYIHTVLCITLYSWASSNKSGFFLVVPVELLSYAAQIILI